MTNDPDNTIEDWIKVGIGRIFEKTWLRLKDYGAILLGWSLMLANTARLWLLGCRINDTRASPATHLADYRKPVEVYRGVVLHSIDSGSLNIFVGHRKTNFEGDQHDFIMGPRLQRPSTSINSLNATGAGNVEIICSKIKMISSQNQRRKAPRRDYRQLLNWWTSQCRGHPPWGKYPPSKHLGEYV